MDLKKTLAGSLVSMALVAGCGFQFTNPVEECPSSGCVVLSGDGGSNGVNPDAGVADGGGEFTLESSWQTEVVFDDGSGENRFSKAALGFASNEPFVAFAEIDYSEASDPTGHLSRRNAGQWSNTALGPFCIEAGIQLHALESAAAPSLVEQYCGTLQLLQWNDELDVLDTYTLRNRSEEGCYARVFVTRDETGSFRFLRVVDGVLTLLTWDGGLEEVTFASEAVTQAARTEPLAIEHGHTGNLHVFFSEQGGGLSYGFRDSNGWQLEVVPTTSYFLVAAVDAQDQPNLCFATPGVLSGSNSLQCLRRTGGAWESEFVRANTRSTSFRVDGLEVDSSNKLHLVYRELLQLDETTVRSSLHHAEWDGTGWTDTTIGKFEGPWTGEIDGVAFALDQQDRPHVTFGVQGRYLHAVPFANE